MTDRARILESVYAAVRDTNEALEQDQVIATGEDSVILGDGAQLDSLGFVTLLVAVEREVDASLGSCPGLIDALSDPDAGVATLGDLADFIAVQME